MKKRKPLHTYFWTSLNLYGFTLLFGLAGMIFILFDAYIPQWAQILVSPFFIAPMGVITFILGKREGEALYKDCTRGSLTEIHDKKAVEIPLYKMIYYVLGYAVPIILFAFIAFGTKVVVLRSILAIFFSPVTMFFMGVGAFRFGSTVGEQTVITPDGGEVLYMYLPAVLVICAVFFVGFTISVLRLKRRQAEIESELRSFDN